jgi:chemotaxis methyl-accepting protein methylase
MRLGERPSVPERAVSTDPQASAPVADPGELLADDMAWLVRMLEVIRERKGIDFRGYRVATLLRRVRNRMISAGVRTLPEYFERLQTDPEEADALTERLTIKVSRFFRDAATFAALRQAIAQRRVECGGRPLAIWSAGCGQGEEPYSLAMLLEEQESTAATSDVVGTDIDSAAITFARNGCYPLASIEELPAELRLRYFEQQISAKKIRCCVQPELRRRVDFRLHDLTASSSPPDGRQFDLVCCRNVLIYLEHPLQARVERLLARSLLPGGVLCLGEAEWLLPEIAPAFDVIDRKARVFKLRSDPEEKAPS